MRMYDLIHKKRDGEKLTKEEISFFVNGVTDGSIPDYQITAFLMAVYFKGLDAKETADLTVAMAHSGDMADLSSIDGFKVDKHSTGGVGDKTTMIVAPVVASCGVSVAKMSGRGLGHTGGTVDKLESIPGFDTMLSTERFFEVVRKAGLSVVGQTGNFAPADKKLYALRDVTATVDNIGLIASSIMSKKYAAGSDGIVLDVKTGSGSFMKTTEDSINLAKAMVEIGDNIGKKTIALITDMNRPLGHAVGNSMEVIEAVETLHGNGPEDLTRVCIELAANMLTLAGKGTLDECRELARDAIASGRAFESFCKMVKEHGGDINYIEDTSLFNKAEVSYDIKANCDGYITSMDTEAIGIAAVMLGAGREVKDGPIDFAAGIHIGAKTGDEIKCGDVIATLYTNKPEAIDAAARKYLGAVTIGSTPTTETKMIHARVYSGGVERY